MRKQNWIPTALLVLLIGVFAALGQLDARTLAITLLVPLVLLGMHCQEHWSQSMRVALLGFLVLTTSVFATGLVWLVLRNVNRVPEWDFVGFWLHARTAALGQNFYDPGNASALASTMQLSDVFRREIVDAGFWYPPPSMLVFWPLGFFAPPTALALWSIFQLAAMVASIVLLRKRFFERRGAVELLACATLVGAAYGTWLNFNYSQSTFLALLAMLLLWPRPNSSTGGMWMAVACLVKPFLVVLTLVPILGRRWRAVLSFVLSIFALSLLSIAAFGRHTFAGYFIAGPVGTKPEWVFSESTNQSILGLILRLSQFEHCGTTCVTNATFLSVAAVLGGATLVAARRMTCTHDEWALALWLLFGLLVYPVSQVCYTILLVPVLLLFWRERAHVVGGTWAVAMGAGAIYGLMLVGRGQATVAAYAMLWLSVAFSGTRLARQADAASMSR